MEQRKLVDRGALYYPYIHVRDENWLKATLLCFPSLDRMVPEGHEVNDGEVAAYFAATQGRFGRRMLGRRDLADSATQHARTVLLGKLRDDLDAVDLDARFSRQAARNGPYEDGENAFQIHEYKLGSELFEFVGSNSLDWKPPAPVRGNATWWSIHPVLGEAIMSTNAVALAKAHDLEIVTSDGPVLQALLGTAATDVYDVLVRQQVFGMPRADTEKVNDLMRYVIVSAFDLEGLSLEEIGELNRQRADLSALKAALLDQVEDLGAMPDRQAWHDVLAARSKDVLEDWATRSSLKSLISSAGGEQLAGEFEDFLKEIAPAALAGTAATAWVGLLPGLAVGVVFGGVSLVRHRHQEKRPYRFLSRLKRAGARPRHILEASPV